MKKLTLPVKIGSLMTLFIVLIAATGYLSFRSLSSIVASIQIKSQPDLRLLTIRGISVDLEKAENSVRLFIHTRRQQDIAPYYNTIPAFDKKISILRNASRKDTLFLAQLDTISRLIEENILNWNEMLYLYHNDSLDDFIRKLTAKMAVGMLNDKEGEKSILKRVFGRKTETLMEQQEIILDLRKIEEQDSLQNTRLQVTESQLASTGAEIRARLFLLIAKMEEEVTASMQRNASTADQLARKTYYWLALFALLGTLLVILVVVIVSRFVRKTRDYQRALIRSKDETEKLARTKERFIANMSHEIRTPVNAIFGFSEQLLYENLDDKNRKIVGIIKSSADHLVKTVNDVLDFSRLQNAKIILDKTHFLVGALCEEVQLLFKDKAAGQNTRLFYILSPTLPLVLYGDPFRLKQILYNLVGNAVKFTVDGEVHFTIGCEALSVDQLNLVVKVTDNGIGIRADMQEIIFDDFIQAEADTARKYGGTGLGLSIVKKLVELHQGTISLESQQNKGTVVTCTIPYASGSWEKIELDMTGNLVPGYFKNLALLIVDDEEYNRMLFRTILDRWGVHCEEAIDGRQAIEMLSVKRFDLVFMDVRMPDMDGLQATTHIRETLRKNPEDLPVIGISATQTTEELQAWKASGMTAFLSKPFTEKMLMEVISSVIMPESPKVNLDNLYHLANHDITFIKQMLIRFIESTDQGLQEIQMALTSGRTEAVMELAHKIVAPCRHLGADMLYTHLKTLENQAQNHENIANLAGMYENAQSEFAVVKKELQDHLAKMHGLWQIIR
jgi:signal transduction histidine kinase/DNA-binding response OmpR family regulator